MFSVKHLPRVAWVVKEGFDLLPGRWHVFDEVNLAEAEVGLA